jgi:hypothetical protein
MNESKELYAIVCIGEEGVEDIWTADSLYGAKRFAEQMIEDVFGIEPDDLEASQSSSWPSGRVTTTYTASDDVRISVLPVTPRS